MSQRRFTTPRYEVLAGWDRPLQYLFLVITARATGEIVYSNLDDPQGPGLSLNGIRQRLAQFGITPPATLWDDLAADRRADAGPLAGIDEGGPQGEAGVDQGAPRSADRRDHAGHPSAPPGTRSLSV